MEKPYYRRSEFWFSLLGITPGAAIGMAEVILQITGDGTLDPSNPLYILLIKVAAGLTAIYTVSRQLNKAVSAFRDNSHGIDG